MVAGGAGRRSGFLDPRRDPGARLDRAGGAARPDVGDADRTVRAGDARRAEGETANALTFAFPSPATLSTLNKTRRKGFPPAQIYVSRCHRLKLKAPGDVDDLLRVVVDVLLQLAVER